MSDRKTKGGYESADIPASELGPFPEVLTRPAFHYTVTAYDADGNQADVTVGPIEGALHYAEYATGPSPWWKRAWRRLRRAR